MAEDQRFPPEKLGTGAIAPYSIAAEAGLSPSQLYRFLAEDPEKRRGLSLEALDGIAKALDLKIGPERGDDAMVDAALSQRPAIPEPFNPPVVGGSVNNVAGTQVAPNASDESAGQGVEPGPAESSTPDVDFREEYRLRAAKWPHYYNITSSESGFPDRRIDVSAFEESWQGGVKFAVGSFGSPGIQELWATHSRRTRLVDHARIAFWEFVSNIAKKNTKLLGVQTLAETFGDLNRLIRDPDDLGRIAGVLKFEDATLSLREDAAKFIARIEQICREIGIERAIDHDWNRN